jgi:hypothetical protein
LIAPIIVTAEFGAEDHRWLDDQRKQYFPADRNWLEAHLTLFHTLPPSLEPELLRRLSAICRENAPRADIVALMSLGRGVAYRVHSDALLTIREGLADAFSGLLCLQDQAGWRPHVTIQNKVAPGEAKALRVELERSFKPRPLRIKGLAAWYYRGGPWELVRAFPFKGQAS